MAKRNIGQTVSGLPSGQVEPNKNGLVSFSQIEGGNDLVNKVNMIYNQIQQYGLDTNLYRKNDIKILEQDLDPSLNLKINELLNALDNFGVISKGIDYGDKHYSVEEVLTMVLEKWSQVIESDLYTKVERM